MVLYQISFYQTFILLRISLWPIRYCQQVCQKVGQTQKYVLRKQFIGTFYFSGIGAVKRFVITTLVNQVLTANIKFKAAKRFGNMPG